MRALLLALGLAIASAAAHGQGSSYTKRPASVDAASIVSGTVATARGGTGKDYSAATGVNVVPVWGTVSVTGQTALISATTIKATGSSPGAGLYEISAYMTSTVTCGTPGPGVVGITVTYTDETGTKSAQTLPLAVNGGATLATTMALGNTTNSASGRVSFWAAASSNIQYATTYTACTTGTGTYTLRLALKQLQ